MKKIGSVLLAAVLLTAFLSFAASAQEAFPEMQVSVNAKAALLMEADTGKVLMAKNPHEQLPPASVTKIMTLLLVSEAIETGRISLADLVCVSTEASGLGGSQIWLKEGERMTVEDLIKAAAIYSANDACAALSEYVSGTGETFVRRMNERAAELGMLDTRFENCTGLDDTTVRHVTSAYDVALMSRELLRHTLILGYTTIWMDTLRGGRTQLVNTNKLIRFYEGATGLKTGTTSRAGCCISATAERDGLRLIAVVLGSDSSQARFDAARKMLDWGFANFAGLSLAVDPSLITDVHVLKGREELVRPCVPKSVRVLVGKGQEESIRQSVDLAVDVAAPVEEGQVLGKVTFLLGDKLLCEYALTCDHPIGALNFWDVFRRLVRALT